MPLKLSLKPKEQVIINGTIVENGERRGAITLHTPSAVSRAKDVITLPELEGKSPENSPLLHLWHITQSSYHKLQRQWGCAAFNLIGNAANQYPEHQGAIRDIAASFAEGDLYQAYQKIRKLCITTGEIPEDRPTPCAEAVIATFTK